MKIARVLQHSIASLSFLLLLAIVFMVITGGGIWVTGKMKLEISQVNAWMAGALILEILFNVLNRWTETPARSPLRRFSDYCLVVMSRLGWVSTVVLAIGTVCLLTWVHYYRHLSFHTSLTDLGVIHHVLAETARGRILACQVCPNGTFLADHLAFALMLVAGVVAVFAPLTELLRMPITVFFLEAALLVGGCLWLVRHSPRPTRFFFFVILICHPVLRYSIVWDFREDHLAFLFWLLAAMTGLQARWRWYVLWSLLALSCKENMAFIAPFLTLSLAWIHRRSPWPWIVTAISLGYAAFSFKYLLPYFQGGVVGTHEIVKRFDGIGSTPAEVVTRILFHPKTLWSLFLAKLWHLEALKYVVSVLGPWIFLIWRGGRSSAIWLVPAVPGILMNLLSGSPQQRSLMFHYELVILPFLMLAAREGLRRCTRRDLLVVLWMAVLFSGRWPGYYLRTYWPTSEDRVRSSWLANLETVDTLAVDYHVYAHVAYQPDLRWFPVPSASTDWPTFLQDTERGFTSKQSIQNAKWFILDRRRVSEATLADQLPDEWEITQMSPDKSLLLVRRRDR